MVIQFLTLFLFKLFDKYNEYIFKFLNRRTMARQESVVIVISKEEWDEHKRKIDELHNARKNSSPLDGYVSKTQVQELYGFSDRTWSRLKSKGLIKAKRLGGLQFVDTSEFIAAIENENL